MRAPRRRGGLRSLLVASVVLAAAASSPAQVPRVIMPATDAPPRDAEAAVPRCQDDRVPEKVRVLLLNLRAPRGAQQLAATLGQVIVEEAARVPGFEMLSTAELKAILDNEAEKAMAGCTDSECMVELASALDAELLISGSLSLAEGEAPTLNLSLVNTRALVTINRVSMTWPGPRDRLPDVARAAAQRLVFEGDMRRPGTVVFEGLPEAGRVVIDDEDLTDTIRDDGTLDLPVGPYRVRLTAPEHEAAEALILVQAGQEHVVDAQLVALEEGTSTWWIWASAGAAATVLVAGVAAGIALTGASAVNTTATVNVPTLETLP